MHVYISGGSGQNGRLVVKEALSRGHSVTALVRNPSSLDPHAQLTTVQGTPESKSDVQKALSTPQSPDVVFVTLSIARTSGSPWAPLTSPPTLLSSTTETLLAGLAALSINPKLVVNSTQGVGDSISSLALPIRLIFQHASSMRIAVEDHGRVDKLVRESGLPFVLARPAMLTAGEAKEVRTWPEAGGAQMPCFGTISRESVAKWMVNVAEEDGWDGKAPIITN